MESINLIKGYGKVNNPVADSQSQPSPHHKTTANPRKAAVVSLLTLSALLLASTAVVFIYKSSTNKHPESTPTESIRVVCSVTHFPNSCITAISALPDLPPEPDPELIFVLSLKVSISELKSISTLPETLLSKSNDPNTESALRDCATLFEDAVSQLNNSVAAMIPGEKTMTDGRMRDVNSWISAAMTDQDTCTDGLEEMGSRVLDEVRAKVQRSKEYMSNSLAILANMQALLHKFGIH